MVLAYAGHARSGQFAVIGEHHLKLDHAGGEPFDVVSRLGESGSLIPLNIECRSHSLG